jgi:hypothetical protein
MDAVRIIDMYVAECFDLVEQLILHHAVAANSSVALLDKYMAHEHVQFCGVLVYQPELVGLDHVYYARRISGGWYYYRVRSCTCHLGIGKQEQE